MSDAIGVAEGDKAVLPVVIAAVPALVKALSDAGISIWNEYRTAGKQRRDEIRDQLDHLKWHAFADLAKS